MSTPRHKIVYRPMFMSQNCLNYEATVTLREEMTVSTVLEHRQVLLQVSQSVNMTHS